MEDSVAANAAKRAHLRRHGWLATVYTGVAWCLPLIGASVGSRITDSGECTGTGELWAAVLLCGACTAACVFGRAAGQHELLRRAFRAVNTQGPDGAGMMVELCRVDAMIDDLDLPRTGRVRAGAAACVELLPARRTSLEEVPL